MQWKFWKKEDDFTLPDLDSLKSDMKQPGGLDLSEQFSPSGSAFPQPDAHAQPSFQPFQQSYPGNASPSYAPGSPIPGAPTDDHHHESVQKDLEIIAAKLDTIRAQLEMLNARMANLEGKGEQPRSGGQKRPWY